MAYGSEMLNAVNDIKTALGGTNDGGIEYGSELLNTVVDIKTIVENGGGGGGVGALLIHTVEDNQYVYLDKTAAEIIAAMPLVYVVLQNTVDEGITFTGYMPPNFQNTIGYTEYEDGGFAFGFKGFSGQFEADSLNDRPKQSIAD